MGKAWEKLEKAWERHDKVMRKSWKSHEKVKRKSWESFEKVMRNSGVTDADRWYKWVWLHSWFFLKIYLKLNP